ncbi:MAG: ankyrin repeat domain-containing protein, partial [Rickettsiales bacterium]
MPQHTKNSQIDEQKKADFAFILQQHIKELINIIPKNINEEEVDKQIKEFASQYQKLNLATKIATADLVNQTNDNGSSLLSIAASVGHLTLVEDLITKGATIDHTNKWNNTALHLASARGFTQIVQLLIDRGISLNDQNEDGNTALHLAVQKNHIEIVQTLIAAGAKLTLQNNVGNTALHLATIEGNLAIVEILLAAARQVAVKLENDDPQPIKTEQTTNKKVTFKKVIPLKERNRSCLPFVNRLGFKPRKTYEDLLIAAKNGDLLTISSLLDNGSNINKTTKSGNTALHLAAQNGYLDLVIFLLQRGAEINGTNKSGNTALHLAAQNGHLEIVRFFIGKHADIDLKTKNHHFSPLYFAAQNNHFEITELLLEGNAKIDNKVITQLYRNILALEEKASAAKAGAEQRNELQAEEEKATKSTEEEILVILLKKFYADKIQEFTEINERIDKTPTEIFNLLSEFLAEEAKLNEILTIASTNAINISKPQNSPVANNLGNSAEEEKTNLAPVSLTITLNLSNNMPNIAANITREESETPSRLRNRLLNSYTYSSSKDKITKIQNPINMPSPSPKEPVGLRSKPKIRSLEILPPSPSKARNKIANPNSPSTPISH